MVAAVLLERISLLAALGGRAEDMFGTPVALAPQPGGEQRVGDASLRAEAFGITPGMRVGEAFARCPELRLVAPDPEATRSAWSSVLDRLEQVGASVESDHPGSAFFDCDGLRGLHGGMPGVLRAVARAVPRGARIGVAPSRFSAHAAATEASRRTPRTVAADQVQSFLAPLPVRLLGSRAGLEALPEVLERLGIRTLGEVAALQRPRLAERFGHAGVLAHELARGDDTALQRRRPAEPVVERLELPEAATGPQLERVLELLVARVLARRERRGRTLRGLVLSVRFVEGGTWRTAVGLRQPTVDPVRLRLAVLPRLHLLPAPAESLALEVEAFGPPARAQGELVEDPAGARRARMGEAIRHVRQVAGAGSVLQVLQVEPSSRWPERRAALAPWPGR